MPSRKSNTRKSPPDRSKAATGCSEAEVARAATELAKELRPGDRVLLEGPMGAGKSTFARALLLGLGVEQPPEGSPTFAIAHEYRCARGEVVHMDLYRLKSEAELEEAGISVYFWERELIAICEWLAQFPEYEEQVVRTGRVIRVRLGFSREGEDRRDLGIERS